MIVKAPLGMTGDGPSHASTETLISRFLALMPFLLPFLLPSLYFLNSKSSDLGLVTHTVTLNVDLVKICTDFPSGSAESRPEQVTVLLCEARLGA